ncbi:carboxypeptidase-like regulatory domain-containing protein [Pelagicoccus sp. SDUM812005]|nr:carboxypeptidase-like regulatory domain-containing protein [Pelagicoccus sp. SDUM812005]
MTSRILVALALFASLAYCSSAYEARSTTTTVRVVDENGEGIQGAMVGVTYSPLRGDKYVTGEGLTDSEGLFRFTGIAYYEVFVSAEKDGYYKSREEALAYAHVDGQKMSPNDPQVELVLKEIEDPVAMYVRANFEVTLLEMEARVGFDLMLMDWVAPYGGGKSADVFFEMRGHYEGPDDRSALLIMSFPNEGDGVWEFQADQGSGSFLRSPQLAPTEGYIREKSWSSSRIKTVDDEFNEAWSTSGEKRSDANYVLRIRTELDEEGRVEKANYAKIYGDIGFYGYHPDGSYLYFDGLYFNPEVNDRRLEFDMKKNLLDSIPTLERPKLP